MPAKNISSILGKKVTAGVIDYLCRCTDDYGSHLVWAHSWEVNGDLKKIFEGELTQVAKDERTRRAERRQQTKSGKKAKIMVKK